MATLRDQVAQLIADGWSVVPIVAGRKNPNDPDWLTKTYAPDDFPEGSNVGVKCGAASGWRVDVDLDAPEAVQAGGHLLYNTGLVHGRAGKPASHWWYLTPGTVTSSYKDIDGSMLVELRSNGGQTVVPPSTHSSGEAVEWVRDGKPSAIAVGDLVHSVRSVAITALFARHWGTGGSRHMAAGHVAGFFLRLGFDAPTTIRMVKTIAQIAKDDEVTDRERMARDTAEKYARGEKVTGGPKLAECFTRGAELAARVYLWMEREGDDLLDTLNERHLVAEMGADTIVLTEREGESPDFLDFEAFRRRYYNQYVGKKRLGEWWLSHPQQRRAERIVFAPPPQKIGPNDYNLWRGFTVDPDPNPEPETRCAYFLAHLYRVICNGNYDHYNYVLNILALTVQRPGAPVEVAIVMRGHPRSGKGTFVELFGELFGQHYAQVDKQEHVTGRFNGQLSGKVVVFADEALWAGNKKDIGALRRLVTERTQMVERKYRDAVMESNSIHLFMATNEDWVWPVSFRERRGFVLDVEAKPFQEPDVDPDYFNNIRNEWANGGNAAFLAFCLQRHVPGNRMGPLPQTSGLLAQQKLSLEPLHQWWLECLTAGEIGPTGAGWPDFAAHHWLHQDYLRVTDEIGQSYRRMTAMQLSDAMQKLLPRKARRARRHCTLNMAKPGMTPLPVQDQRRGWDLPSLTDCRDAFDTLTGLKYNWPPTDETQPPLPEVETVDAY